MVRQKHSHARIPSSRRLRGALCGVALAFSAGTGQAQDVAADAYFTANGGSASAAGAFAEGEEAVAVGEASNALGNAAMALGPGSLAEGEAALAIGRNAAAQAGATALGDGSRAAAADALAIGRRAQAQMTGTSVFGADAIADEVYATALGRGARASGQQALAVGFLGTALGNGATALGGYSAANGLLSSAIGYGTRVDAVSATALGYRAAVAADARGAVAIGAGARAEEADVVSFGSGDGINGAATRRLTRLGAGRLARDSTDALNGGQLFPLFEAQALAFGGGAGLDAQGGFVAPTYQLHGNTYHNVGDALAALDGRVDMVAGDTAALATRAGRTERQVQALEAAQAELAAQPALVTATDNGSTSVGRDARVDPQAGQATAVGDSARASAAGAVAVGQGARASAAGAVALGQGALADRADSVSVGRAGAERQVTHVAAGSRDTDAVNKAQLDGGIAAANRYADQRYSALSDSFAAHRGEVDDRFHRQDQRIDRQGAMNAAMLNMATSAAGLRTQNRVGVGAGFQSGQSALSLGYQRAISERATVTLGGAFSGNDASLGIGAGFGW